MVVLSTSAEAYIDEYASASSVILAAMARREEGVGPGEYAGIVCARQRELLARGPLVYNKHS